MIKDHFALEISLFERRKRGYTQKTCSPEATTSIKRQRKVASERSQHLSSLRWCRDRAAETQCRPGQPAGGGYAGAGGAAPGSGRLQVRGWLPALGNVPGSHPSPIPRAVGGETGAKEKADNAWPGRRPPRGSPPARPSQGGQLPG